MEQYGPYEVAICVALEGPASSEHLDQHYAKRKDVGKLADIVLLDANPLEDIKNTQTIWRVIKGGFVFDPEELRPERN